MNRKTTFLLIILSGISVVNMSSDAYAWHTYWLFGDTHWRITDHAISAVSITEYPDLYKFTEQLRDGSETEAHAPPTLSIPGSSATSPHRWWPNPEHWWNYSYNPQKKCALQWYDQYSFGNAYETIGYLLHLEQDQRVSAHLYRCIHGTIWHPTDDLEDYVDGPTHYGYATGSTPWTFVDNQSRTWYYWLSDDMDDDDENNVADGPGGGGTITDHDGDYDSEWGLAEYVFGTYGYGDNDPLPGKNEGYDYFEQYPKEAIGKESQPCRWRLFTSAGQMLRLRLSMTEHTV